MLARQKPRIVNDPLWDITDLTMPGRTTARLEHLSLHIPSGITAILGESGAGKTTLCNLLVGFERPVSGRVTALMSASPQPATGGRLPLFWSPEGGLWPHLTVTAHLTAVAPPHPLHLTCDLLRAFTLDHCSDAMPAQLSAGERERLGVARAVASEATVLVLDEPFAHVDGTVASRCWLNLLTLVRAHAGSLVYTTHAPERVIGHAQTVVCLRDGRLLHHGSVEDLYHRPPSHDAATCLGATNWLSAAEAAGWFPGSDAIGCVRPERVQVEPVDGGTAVVHTAQFHGHVASVDVERTADGQRRHFLHRPSQPLRAGERVTLSLLPGPTAHPRASTAMNTPGSLPIGGLLLLVMTLFAVGCSKDNSTTPTLTFTSEQTWSLPVVAAAQPAPRGLGALGDDQVMVLDTAGRVLVYNGAGTVIRHWQMPAFDVGRPEGVVQLPDGRIAVADTHYHRVVLFDAQGTVISMIGGPDEDKKPGGFLYPVGITTDRTGNLYVSEYGGNDRVQKFSAAGKLLATCGSFGTAPGQFQRPQGIAWHDGRLYVADAMNNRIQVFQDDGRFIGVLGGEHPPELRFPYNVVAAADGTLTVVEYSGGCITRLTSDGKVLGRYGRPGGGDGEFSTPWGMTIDGRGRVWVADTGNRRLVELTP